MGSSLNFNFKKYKKKRQNLENKSKTLRDTKAYKKNKNDRNSTLSI